MRSLNRRHFILTGISACCATACSPNPLTSVTQQQGYMCPPCGCSADDVVFDSPGSCPACNMVLRPTVDPELGKTPIALPTGTSRYRLDGAHGDIHVHCYRPETGDVSRMLVVLPGAGRNGDDYRNVWLEAAARYQLLVLSLEFPETSYDMEAYNLCGVVKSLDVPAPIIERINAHSRIIRLDRDPVSVEIESNRSRWLFGDIKRVVDHATTLFSLSAAEVDVFGHSAGAQVAHRLALFDPTLIQGRIVAANAGWYTQPVLTHDYPLGIRNVDIDEAASLRASLLVLLGENDNSDAAGGTLLHTPSLDALQGLHRLARGRRFMAVAQDVAGEGNISLNWALHTVPEVGHDYRKMSRAAASLLYASGGDS